MLFEISNLPSYSVFLPILFPKLLEPLLYKDNVTVNTNVTVHITFEQVRAKIEDMSSLTEEQTKEALEKVSEIEAIVNGDGNKKFKWERIKPILTWLADKSFDVGMVFLPLLLKLGE